MQSINEKEQDELTAVELLAQVVAVVFNNELTAEEMREQVRLILESAKK